MIIFGLVIGILFGFLGGVFTTTCFVYLQKKYEARIQHFVETGNIKNPKGLVFQPQSELGEMLEDINEDIKIG